MYDAVVFTAYALGAVLLAGEAAVHIQQYRAIFHEVRWLGPLFLATAAASVVAVAGLVVPRTRQPAALLGVVMSVLALGALVVSYGRGLFGWQEAGFRTPVELTVITEVGAAIFLSVGLAVRGTLARSTTAASVPPDRSKAEDVPALVSDSPGAG